MIKEKGKEMIKGKLLRGTLGLVIATFAVHVSADTSWNTTDNSVTYSVFQDNFALGLDNNGDNLTKSVWLSKLDLAEVASREGGTAANFTLSSVVLSMNGTVYGTIKVTNTSGASVTPRYSIYGQSMLTYGLESTPDENYNATVLFGAIAPGVESTKDVNVLGSATPNTVTITQDLERFLGIGTIETIGAFPVFGTFISGGTMIAANIALQGQADIAVTYYYSEVPEPTSMALLSLAGAVLALRRKRVVTA